MMSRNPDEEDEVKGELCDLAPDRKLHEHFSERAAHRSTQSTFHFTVEMAFCSQEVSPLFTASQLAVYHL